MKLGVHLFSAMITGKTYIRGVNSKLVFYLLKMLAIALFYVIEFFSSMGSRVMLFLDPSFFLLKNICFQEETYCVFYRYFIT
jgi:hypothetical protein